MTLSEAIQLADKRAPKAEKRNSAELCVSNAWKWQDRNPRTAAHWACRSLAYSVGVFSPEYAAARQVLESL